MGAFQQQDFFVDHVKVLNILRGVRLSDEKGGQPVDVEVVELKFDSCANLPQKEFNLIFA